MQALLIAVALTIALSAAQAAADQMSDRIEAARALASEGRLEAALAATEALAADETAFKHQYRQRALALNRPTSCAVAKRMVRKAAPMTRLTTPQRMSRHGSRRSSYGCRAQRARTASPTARASSGTLVGRGESPARSAPATEDR